MTPDLLETQNSKLCLSAVVNIQNYQTLLHMLPEKHL